jgi:hypothetical protein
MFRLRQFSNRKRRVKEARPALAGFAGLGADLSLEKRYRGKSACFDKFLL